ncbi:hypothetical protein Zmor_019008 [Zophobas morio]|uniref:Uncharacterized protein n=1 Tax=Zophobas morio TaxID=2755281 RepID=A0AA38ME93_9CUCU|nr:hypothetical protein Zmor_019008 [Zophobas morio]
MATPLISELRRAGVRASSSARRTHTPLTADVRLRLLALKHAQRSNYTVNGLNLRAKPAQTSTKNSTLLGILSGGFFHGNKCNFFRADVVFLETCARGMRRELFLFFVFVGSLFSAVELIL